MMALTFGMPFKPISVATDLGTRSSVPPPPRGVGVSFAMKVATIAILCLALGVRPRVRRRREVGERRRQSKPEQLVVRAALSGRGVVERGWLKRRFVPRPCVEPSQETLHRRDRLSRGKRA